MAIFKTGNGESVSRKSGNGKSGNRGMEMEMEMEMEMGMGMWNAESLKWEIFKSRNL